MIEADIVVCHRCRLVHCKSSFPWSWPPFFSHDAFHFHRKNIHWLFWRCLWQRGWNHRWKNENKARQKMKIVNPHHRVLLHQVQHIMTTHPKRKKVRAYNSVWEKSFRGSSLTSHLKSWSVPFAWRLGRKIFLSVAVLILKKMHITDALVCWFHGTETSSLVTKYQSACAQVPFAQCMLIFFVCFWYGWCRDSFKLAWDPLDLKKWSLGPKIIFS